MYTIAYFQLFPFTSINQVSILFYIIKSIMNIITVPSKPITFGIGIEIFLPLGDAIRLVSILDSHELSDGSSIHLHSGNYIILDL